MSANRPAIFILTLLTLFISLSSPVLAQQPVEDSLFDLSVPEQPAVTTPRSTRPISKIAENATIITSGEIVTLNAHTLADVLQTVPGVQLDQMQTPGAYTLFSIQGANDGLSHILLLIDGVKMNTQLQGMTDPALIPVQQIERIEIIKGAAAGSWGQALGGVINVITKSPDNERAIGGQGSSALGERGTRINSGEASGTVSRFGYYLSGGSLHSKGLLPNNGVNNNNGYAKFTFDLPGKGTLTAGLSYNEVNRGLDENAQVHDDDTTKRTYTFLTFSYPLAERLTLELNGKTSSYKATTKLNDVIDGIITPYNHSSSEESKRSGRARLVWGDNRTNLTSGIEYEHGAIKVWDILTLDSPYLTDKRIDALAAYVNGTLSFGDLIIIPGIRYDHTGLGNDCTSYSMGATYQLTGKTLLRGYYANGFGLPLVDLNSGPQRVWTLQSGVESEIIPYLWLKGTLFYNKIWNATDNDLNTSREQIKQGFELEARTTPFYGFSLAGGYTYIDARDRDSGDRLELVPSSLLKASLHYAEKSIGLKGIVTANYVKWNTPADNNARYSATITDLHLSQHLLPDSNSSPEIFFSVRNLFNGAQYQNDSTYSTYKNTPRWIEGGVRFSF